MNYQAFTNDSLTMMYNGVRGALAADDALSDLGAECKFRVRQTPGWKAHAAALEAEMLKRRMFFELIDWSQDQTIRRRLCKVSSRWSSSPDAPRRTGPINQDHGTSLKGRCTTLVPMPSFLPNL